MRDLTLHTIKAFFTWVLNSRQGKDGRRVKGLRSEDSIGTYYKYFRLACKRAIGGKIDNDSRGFKRMVRRVSDLAVPTWCFP
jgi:hypothetical protein